jgi:hypothetical protein
MEGFGRRGCKKLKSSLYIVVSVTGSGTAKFDGFTDFYTLKFWSAK